MEKMFDSVLVEKVVAGLSAMGIDEMCSDKDLLDCTVEQIRKIKKSVTDSIKAVETARREEAKAEAFAKGKNLAKSAKIGDKFGISSTNGVRSILSALIKKGYIRRAARLSRGIEILNASAKVQNTPAEAQNSENTVEVPIIGRVAAGTPILAVQNIEGTVTVD